MAKTTKKHADEADNFRSSDRAPVHEGGHGTIDAGTDAHVADNQSMGNATAVPHGTDRAPAHEGGRSTIDAGKDAHVADKK